MSLQDTWKWYSVSNMTGVEYISMQNFKEQGHNPVAERVYNEGQGYREARGAGYS